MATYPTDPLFTDQWYLKNNTEGQFDLNLVDVWDDYTGSGIEIAALERGIERTHPDLQANYSTDKDWDFANNDTDANNGKSSSHGTRVAGLIAAAANNGVGGVGIAYNATLFGLARTNLSHFSEAVNNASGVLQTGGENREADILNMSASTYSYFDIGQNIDDMAALNLAIDTAAQVGRNGLGTILVKSAGNRRTTNFETNAMSWNANPRTISVAAVGQDGFVSSRSSYGSSVLVSAFGKDGIFTTDLVGEDGASSGDYTDSFSGTSASSAMVSGVTALMLEANPNLGWRDVQNILAYSSRQVGSDVSPDAGTGVSTGISGSEKYAWSFNGATDWNGGGLHFSNDYGFGLVDAKAAVRLAETWHKTPQTSANEVLVSGDFLDDIVTITTNGASFTQDITAAVDIEHVEVEVSFSRWYDLGDLDLQLISPSGTTSILIDNTGEDDGTAAGGFGTGQWTFTSNAFWGEDTVGTWTIAFDDADSSRTSPITIDDINITFRGKAASDDDTFVFTREYSDYAGQFGHTTLINGDLGFDILNAAAVDSATTINLLTGQGSIDGVESDILSIERVVTGDGDDQLTGDDQNNQLQGMRGNDQLAGNGGDDELSGGRGDDTIQGGTGDDTIDGGLGVDRAVFNGDRAYFEVTEISTTELEIVDHRERSGEQGNGQGDEQDEGLGGGTEGRDRLLNIERFVFSDGEYDGVGLLEQFTISGTVFNDVDGLDNDLVDGVGVGTVGDQPLYVYLVDDASNRSVRRVTVGANGQYSFTNIAGGIAYTLELSTEVLSIGDRSPLSADGADGDTDAIVILPDGFELTGESSPESDTVDMSIDGQINLTPLSQDLIDANFGIRPITMAPDGGTEGDEGTDPGNPPSDGGGGSDGSDGSDEGTDSGTDPGNPPGTNALDAVDDMGTTSLNKSLTIDVLANDTYAENQPPTITSVSSPANGTAEIIDGQLIYTPDAGFFGEENFDYTITDNNGETDTAQVTVTVDAEHFTISGTVFNDMDGLENGLVDGVGIGMVGGQQLYAYLVDEVSTKTVQRVAVNPDGLYSFARVDGGTAYDVEVSTDVLEIGQRSPLVTNRANGRFVNLPGGFAVVGEFDPESMKVDPTPEGNIDLKVLTQNISNVNFGIGSIMPSPDSGDGDTPPNDDPGNDDNNGDNDNGETIPDQPPEQFTISGTVFNDSDGLENSTVDGMGIGTVGGQQLYAYLVDEVSTRNVQRVIVGADGVYAFADANGGLEYDIEISTDVLEIGRRSPLSTNRANGRFVSLPDGFAVVGEFDPESGKVDPTPEGNIDLKVLTQNISNVNFGIGQVNRSDSI